ncbi:hypothetical protein QOT17_004166 [Balamuthia mandrillaris]
MEPASCSSCSCSCSSSSSPSSSVPPLALLCIDPLVRFLAPNAALIQQLLPTDLKEKCLQYLLFCALTATQSPLALPPSLFSFNDYGSLPPQPPLSLRPCHFSIFLPSCSNIHSLDLSGLKDPDGDVLTAIANALNERNNLRQINLASAECFTVALSSLVAKCGEKLELLELSSALLQPRPSYARGTDRGFFEYSRRGEEEWYSYQPTDDEEGDLRCLLSVLGTHCPNLLHLGLHGQYFLVNKLPKRQPHERHFRAWQALLRGCSGLEYLDLSFTDLTPQHLGYLPLCLPPPCRLRVLLLQGNEQLALGPGEEAVNQVLAHCTRLQRLNLLDCGSLRVHNLKFPHRKAVYGLGEKNEGEEDGLNVFASAGSFYSWSDWAAEVTLETSEW